MKPTTPVSAMSQGGTFMRPGAMAWGQPGSQAPANPATPAAIEHALAAAAKDPDRVTDLLDELSRGRLWLPLPDDARPVTDGSAVLLPTVTYLGAEFVPAFTSAAAAGRLARPRSRCPPRSQDDADPRRRRPVRGHAAHRGPGRRTGPAAAGRHGHRAQSRGGGQRAHLPRRRRLPGRGAGAQPTAPRCGWAARPPTRSRCWPNPGRTEHIPAVQQASRAWLSVPGQGEGLVISVTLHDPGSEAAHGQVISAIEWAVGAVPEQGFPIDVTFPGEGEPGQVDEWIAAQAEPFYIRTLRRPRRSL